MENVETMRAERNEYSSRLIYFLAAIMSHHNVLSFLVPEGDVPSSYGAEKSTKSVANDSLKLLSVLLVARLAGTTDKGAMNDISEGLSPFLVDALSTVEEAMRLPIQEEKESVNADAAHIQQQEQTILFLTTARRALENGEYDNFNEAINHMLIGLGITPEQLDNELKKFTKLAALLNFSFNEGMDDKTNEMTGVIQM